MRRTALLGAIALLAPGCGGGNGHYSLRPTRACLEHKGAYLIHDDDVFPVTRLGRLVVHSRDYDIVIAFIRDHAQAERLRTSAIRFITSYGDTDSVAKLPIYVKGNVLYFPQGHSFPASARHLVEACLR